MLIADDPLRQSQAEGARLRLENDQLRARIELLEQRQVDAKPATSLLAPLWKIARESSCEEDTGRRVLALPNETLLILIEHGGRDWRARVRNALDCAHCKRRYGGGNSPADTRSATTIQPKDIP